MPVLSIVGDLSPHAQSSKLTNGRVVIRGPLLLTYFFAGFWTDRF